MRLTHLLIYILFISIDCIAQINTIVPFPFANPNPAGLYLGDDLCSIPVIHFGVDGELISSTLSVSGIETPTVATYQEKDLAFSIYPFGYSTSQKFCFGKNRSFSSGLIVCKMDSTYGCEENINLITDKRIRFSIRCNGLQG